MRKCSKSSLLNWMNKTLNVRGYRPIVHWLPVSLMLLCDKCLYKALQLYLGWIGLKCEMLHFSFVWWRLSCSSRIFKFKGFFCCTVYILVIGRNFESNAKLIEHEFAQIKVNFIVHRSLSKDNIRKIHISMQKEIERLKNEES